MKPSVGIAAPILMSLASASLQAQAAPQATPLIEASPNTSAAAPAAEAAAASHSRMLEEVVVTAQKREENLQNVPISIQAFSGENLDARGVTDATALQRITPGLTITQSVGFTLIYLRGVGSDAFLLGDPSVAYYIDNIYFPFSQGLAQEFGALERIEVLKGPQGTLFGRNAVGGAVNVLTKAPKFGERSSSIESNFSNFATIENRVHTNIPLGDTAAMTVTAFYNTKDFYQQGRINQVPLSANADGEALDPIISRAARIKLRWMPVEEVDATVAAMRYLSQGAGTLFQLNAYPSKLARLLGVDAQKGYNGALSDPVYQTIDNKVAYGDIKWNLPWFDLRLLGSDQLIRTGADYDYDGSPEAIVGFAGPRLYADVQSAEFQMLSNKSWGPENLKWILGSYFFRSKSGYDDGLLQKVAAVNTLSTALRSLLGVQNLPDFLQGLIPTGNALVYGKLGTRSMAYFAQGSLDLTDWMSLTLGGRYQTEKRYVIEAYDALPNADGSSTPIYPLNPDSNLKSTTTKSFSPKVSVDFHLLDDVLVYASYQTATKSGTFNPLKLLRPVDYVAPEKTKALELGLKTSFFDGLMNFSGALFAYNTQNLQVQYVSLLNGGVVTFESAKAAQVRGMDFDLSAALLPNVFDDLALSLSAAYIPKAEFTDFKNGSGFADGTPDQGSGLFTVNNNFTGNRISRSPRFTGTVTLSKTWQVPGGPLELAGDYYYNSGFYYTAQNSALAEQGSYGLLGLRTSYLYEPWRLRTTIYGNNVLDKFYSIGALQADFGTNLSLGAPVTYGLRLSWDF